jgi:hypothetical protein
MIQFRNKTYPVSYERRAEGPGVQVDLDMFLYLHRSCHPQSGQPSELFIFRVSAPDEGQHGRERSSGQSSVSTKASAYSVTSSASPEM